MQWQWNGLGGGEAGRLCIGNVLAVVIICCKIYFICEVYKNYITTRSMVSQYHHQHSSRCQ